MVEERQSDAAASWAHLVPSEDTRELLDATRQHFEKLFPVATLLELHDDAVSDTDLWGTLVEHGYSSLGLPEEYEGLGTFSDAAMLAEEAGRALLPAPLTTTIAAVHTALGAGLAHPDPASVLALAVGDGEDCDAVDCLDGADAAFIVTVAGSEAGTLVRVFERAEAEAESTPIDPSRTWSRVTLGPLVQETSLKHVTAEQVLAPGRIVLGAELSGVAARSLSGALEHAATRHQFGQPIGAFQAIKHMLADAHVATESARSLVYGAAAEVTRLGSTERAAYLSLLAAAASAEAAKRAAAMRTQLLGAMGLTAESDNHLAIRRSHQLAHALGTPGELFIAAARMAKHTGVNDD